MDVLSLLLRPMSFVFSGLWGHRGAVTNAANALRENEAAAAARKEALAALVDPGVAEAAAR